MVYNIAVEFKDWITQKYVQWRGNAVGRERTVKDFAIWIGVSQPTMVQWMSGKKLPKSHQSMNGLVAKYGVADVFAALGMPIPDEEDTYPLVEPVSQDEAVQLIRKLALRFDIPVEIHLDQKPGPRHKNE